MHGKESEIKYFEYRLLDSESILFTKEVNDYMKENKDKNFVFLCSNGYYFRIINDESASYLDLINTGNLGYNGSNKLLKMIKEKEAETDADSIEDDENMQFLQYFSFFSSFFFGLYVYLFVRLYGAKI